MSLAIQVISDIHLEYQDDDEWSCLYRIEPECPYLFVIGDIGHFSCTHWDAFWKYCSDNWERVFVVLGNHEYYYHYHDGAKTMNELENVYSTFFDTFDNITFLKYGCVAHLEKENIHVIGATGWSKPSPTIVRRINDFRYIYTTTTDCITPHDMTALHEKEFGWIFRHVENHPHDEIIVMTHFPPISRGVSHPRFETNTNDPTTSYFRNDYDHLLFPNVRAWLFGHTHFSSVQKRHSTFYISNQYGCSDEERSGTVFRKNGLFLV